MGPLLDAGASTVSLPEWRRAFAPSPIDAEFVGTGNVAMVEAGGNVGWSADIRARIESHLAGALD